MKTNIVLGLYGAVITYLLLTHHCPKAEISSHTIDTVYVDTTSHEASVPPQKTRTVYVQVMDSASGVTDSVAASIFTACYDDSTISICADVPVLGNVVGDFKFTYQNKLGYTIYDQVNTFIPVKSDKRLYLGASVSDIGSVSPQGMYLLGSKGITYQYDLRLKQHRVGLMWGCENRAWFVV